MEINWKIIELVKDYGKRFHKNSAKAYSGFIKRFTALQKNNTTLSRLWAINFFLSAWQDLLSSKQLNEIIMEFHR